MLAGEGATAFATMRGMSEADLGTDDSHDAYRSWKENSCQPNYYRSFDGAETTCPPYDTPTSPDVAALMNSRGGTIPTAGRSDDPARLLISENNHDTIGMIVVDKRGDLACGTTTNGAANKIAGRVGDSPLAGAGCYVDNDVGGAAATGDGDVMMRYGSTRDQRPRRVVLLSLGGILSHELRGLWFFYCSCFPCFYSTPRNEQRSAAHGRSTRPYTGIQYVVLVSLARAHHSWPSTNVLALGPQVFALVPSC